eukprot:scaffold235_cov319-Pavlova_lutheri.AAC.1
MLVRSELTALPARLSPPTKGKGRSTTQLVDHQRHDPRRTTPYKNELTNSAFTTASEASPGPYETLVCGTRPPRPHMDEGQWCPFSNNGCAVPELESVPLGVRIEGRSPTI